MVLSISNMGILFRILFLFVSASLFFHPVSVLAESVPDRNQAIEGRFEFPGLAVARERVEIIPQAKGTVLNAAVKTGQKVKKGDVLIRIDPRRYQYIVDQAKAKLKNTHVRFKTVVTEFNRMKGLFEQKLATTTKLYGLSVARDLAAGLVEEAQADLKTAELNLSHTVIRSPIDGFIGRFNTDTGDVVGYSNEPVVLILKYDPIIVIVGIDIKTHLRYRRLGIAGKGKLTGLQLKLPDGKIYQHRGEYVGSFHRVNPKSGRMEHAISFPNKDLLIPPGLPVTVIVEIGKVTQ